MYLYVKALHIIFVVSWFAGLFYIVRLFIYHTETQDMEANKALILQNQYKIMSKRLWYIISWPAMILTFVFGFWMLYDGWSVLNQPYMHFKLTFVFLLLIYHFLCHRIFRQLQNDIIKFTSNQLRIWNEIATLLLVAIVFLIVTKKVEYQGVVGFFSIGILLMLGIKLYKRIRNKP